MSNEIQKMSVFDDRIIQEKPKFAVEKGALSISNSPFNAIASTSSQMSFNIQVPSLNVFIDREMEWTAECRMSMDVEIKKGKPDKFKGADLNKPVIDFGKDVALSPFPLQTSCSTITATINDCVTTINSSDVLNELLRLTNQKKNRLQRTCPTMLDKYQNYNDAVGDVNNPLGTYSNSTDYDNVPNGAYYDIVFLNPKTGEELTGGGSYEDPLQAAVDKVSYKNGVPVLSNNNANNAPLLKYTIAYKYKVTEKLVLSPFIFSDECGDNVGLYGVNNMQLVFNFGNTSRSLRSANLACAGDSLFEDGKVTSKGENNDATIEDNKLNEKIVTNVGFLGNDPWKSAKINCLFLTPSYSVKLPPKSIVPYYEYPRYISTPGDSINAGDTKTLQSQTITLPQIPDMLLIYARPSSYDQNEGDYYLPVDNITLNFDNFSGLLSTMTPEQLYNMSVNNGLEMDWNTWNGQGRVINKDASSKKSSLNASNVALNGGFLLLAMGKDVPLQASQAPSVVGNYTLQYNVRVKNTKASGSVTPKLYTIAINSGFFETQSGSSRILKGVLTESDVIDAPVAGDVVTRGQLKRMVGGSFWSKLGNAVNKAKDVLMNPAVREGVKHFGKKMGGPVKTAVETAERFGYGAELEGDGMTGGARTGGRRGRKANLKNLF